MTDAFTVENLGWLIGFLLMMVALHSFAGRRSVLLFRSDERCNPYRMHAHKCDPPILITEAIDTPTPDDEPPTRKVA